MNGKSSQSRAAARALVTVAVGIAAITLAGCRRGDANAEPTQNGPIIIGPIQPGSATVTGIVLVN